MVQLIQYNATREEDEEPEAAELGLWLAVQPRLNEYDLDGLDENTTEDASKPQREDPFTDVRFKAYDCNNLQNPKQRIFDTTGVD